MKDLPGKEALIMVLLKKSIKNLEKSTSIKKKAQASMNEYLEGRKSTQWHMNRGTA